MKYRRLEAPELEQLCSEPNAQSGNNGESALLASFFTALFLVGIVALVASSNRINAVTPSIPEKTPPKK